MNTRQGWIVTFAGTGINLALGVLYAWSVIAKAMTEDWGISKTASSLPYTVAIIMFAVMMIPAGRWQDKMGPRVVASIGGVLTGLGLIIAGMSQTITGVVIGFGILAGMGIGLGYASATPAAVKWFPSNKKGLITGLVVSGFGLAPVYIAPATNYLINSFGIAPTFRILGIVFLIVTIGCAQLLKNPDKEYQLEMTNTNMKNSSVDNKHHYDWHEIIKTYQFYLLWIMFAFGAFAGLMIIGHLAKIAKIQVDIQWGYALVALLAIFNAGGRIIAGFTSDKLGRSKTMVIVFILQAVVMGIFAKLNTPMLIAAGAVMVGFNYGAILSLFPSTTADYYGTKHLGINYGLIFSAWGIGGVFGPILAGKVADATGGYGTAFAIASILCVLAAGIATIIKPPSEIRIPNSTEVITQ